MSKNDLAAQVLASATAVFRKHKDWADSAIRQVSDANLRRRLDENTNSIAVIMKHIAGNLLSRWTDFLTSDGEKPWRDRDAEFVDDFPDRSAITEYWEQGWNRLFETLDSLTPGDLQQSVTIRGEPHSVALALQRSLAHCAYHVGQILLLARHSVNDDWETITIPPGQSQTYNQQAWGTDRYKSVGPNEESAADS